MIDKRYNFLAPIIIKDLIRAGSKNDGGYLMSNQVIKNCNFLLSFGLGEDWSLEKYFLKKKTNIVHIYDHTINYSIFLKKFYKSIKRTHTKTPISNPNSSCNRRENYCQRNNSRF